MSSIDIDPSVSGALEAENSSPNRVDILDRFSAVITIRIIPRNVPSSFFQVAINDAATVQELQARIESQPGGPVAGRQRLSFRDQELRDSGAVLQDLGLRGSSAGNVYLLYLDVVPEENGSGEVDNQSISEDSGSSTLRPKKEDEVRRGSNSTTDIPHVRNEETTQGEEPLTALPPIQSQSSVQNAPSTPASIRNQASTQPAIDTTTQHRSAPASTRSRPASSITSRYSLFPLAQPGADLSQQDTPRTGPELQPGSMGGPMTEQASEAQIRPVLHRQEAQFPSSRSGIVGAGFVAFGMAAVAALGILVWKTMSKRD